MASTDRQREGVVDVEPLFGTHGLAPEGGMLHCVSYNSFGSGRGRYSGSPLT